MGGHVGGDVVGYDGFEFDSTLTILTLEDGAGSVYLADDSRART